MNAWTSSRKHAWGTTLTVGLALGTVASGAAPASAEPADNASCTAATVTTGAQNAHPFGETVRFNAEPGFGQRIATEAVAPRDECPLFATNE